MSTVASFSPMLAVLAPRHDHGINSISIIISPFAIYEAQMTSSKVLSHHYSSKSIFAPQLGQYFV